MNRLLSECSMGGRRSPEQMVQNLCTFKYCGCLWLVMLNFSYYASSQQNRHLYRITNKLVWEMPWLKEWVEGRTAILITSLGYISNDIKCKIQLKLKSSSFSPTSGISAAHVASSDVAITSARVARVFSRWNRNWSFARRRGNGSSGRSASSFLSQSLSGISGGNSRHGRASNGFSNW